MMNVYKEKNKLKIIRNDNLCLINIDMLEMTTKDEVLKRDLTTMIEAIKKKKME